MSWQALSDRFPDAARDIRLNLQNVLQPGTLTPAQRWGIAVASAIASRRPDLARALAEAARAEVGPPVLDDAAAAAALMAMNNVFYRFRHLVGRPGYEQKPARLRMNRIVRPAADKLDFELMCLAVSAINGCGACMQAHERVVVDGGLSEDHVQDAVRIAATVNAAAVALDLADHPILT